MYFSHRSSSSLYVFVSLLCLSSFFLSLAIDSVSCAGSSLTLVDPNNPMIPRTTDFAECSEPVACDEYYCGNSGATCYERTCRYSTLSRGIEFPDYTDVPSCVEIYTRYNMTLTAAIVSYESPRQVMRSIADGCGVSSQMVILSIATSTTTVVQIINTMSPSLISTAKHYTAYHIELGFFYEAVPDKPADAAASIFKRQLLDDYSTIVDVPGSSFSVGRGRAAAIFLNNTSDFQIRPATFSIQRCSDGTAVTGEEKCPIADPALVATAALHSTSSTTRLSTIILPIVGGVVFIVLIVAAVVIVRRRRANKEQTEKHTEAEAEAAVDVTMA